jgi:hypothetical protein
MEITKKLPTAKNGSPKAEYFSGFGSKMTKRGDIESRFWFQQKKKLEVTGNNSGNGKKSGYGLAVFSHKFSRFY